MRIDRDGNELRQVSVWVPIAQIELMHADGFNVSRFIRDMIGILYNDPSGHPQNDRDRLVAAAPESRARQLAAGGCDGTCLVNHDRDQKRALLRDHTCQAGQIGSGDQDRAQVRDRARANQAATCDSGRQYALQGQQQGGRSR